MAMNSHSKGTTMRLVSRQIVLDTTCALVQMERERERESERYLSSCSYTSALFSPRQPESLHRTTVGMDTAASGEQTAIIEHGIYFQIPFWTIRIWTLSTGLICNSKQLLVCLPDYLLVYSNSPRQFWLRWVPQLYDIRDFMFSSCSAKYQAQQSRLYVITMSYHIRVSRLLLDIFESALFLSCCWRHETIKILITHWDALKLVSIQNFVRPIVRTLKASLKRSFISYGCNVLASLLFCSKQ